MPRRAHPTVPGHADLRRQVGARIRQLRTDLGLTQSDLAGRYYDRKYVSAVELGRITPSLPALLQFSRALKVSVSRLLQGVDVPRERRP